MQATTHAGEPKPKPEMSGMIAGVKKVVGDAFFLKK
jgi:hypothetical protein